MEGDKVIVLSSVTEVNGVPVFDTEIGEKPQFMLDEEFFQHLIQCAVESVKSVCKVCYPNPSSRRMLAEFIVKKASEGF